MKANGIVRLSDWCVNVNFSVDPFDVANNPSNACNGGQNTPLASITTNSLADGTNPSGLGTVVTVTLGAGLNQFVSFYGDYDLDPDDFGASDDFGSAVPSVPSYYSYELGDPFSSNIFSDFASNTLLNINSVDTPGFSPQCCNVAWAMSISGINVSPGNLFTVSFSVSDVSPGTGFFLTQTNQDTNNSIYLSGATLGTPEPATFWLFFAAAATFTCLRLVKRIASTS